MTAPPAAWAAAPLLAVIPTVGLLGPLALLAMLFPALFGGLALWLRRWLVLFTVASVDSTLYLLHAWFAAPLRAYWWGSDTVLWAVLALVALAGALWSWQRCRLAKRAGARERIAPRKTDALLLGLLALIGVCTIIWSLSRHVLMASPWRELLPIWITAWAGVLYVVLAALSVRVRPTPLVYAEGFMLAILALTCAGYGLASGVPGLGFTAPSDELPATTANGRRSPRILWQFWPHERGLIASSPVVAGDRVYAAALVFDGANQSGALYCLDRATGHELWRFSDNGSMKPVFSTPCVANGRLYIGEGFHQDADCKLYCLDANSGVLQWAFQTTSHTEATPCVAGGRVYFGAGDDGVYCLDAVTGKLAWHFQGPHVDMRVAVVGNRLFGGSGYGTREMFCLNAKTGQSLWRTPAPLSVFGSPVAAGEQVFFGMGNGDLDHSADHPAGALVCLDAHNGRVVWRYAAGDGVHVRPTVAAQRVYCAARDGRCYCVDRQHGQQIWSQDLGSPIVTAPQLTGSDIYVLASAGRVWCLDAECGAIRWSMDLAKDIGSDVRLRSSPFLEVLGDEAGEKHRLYFGADASNLLNSEPLVIALEEVLTPRR